MGLPAVEDMVLLEVSTNPNPLATLLNVKFGFDQKRLSLTRPLGACRLRVHCGVPVLSHQRFPSGLAMR